MAKKGQKAYLGLDWIPSVILAIIPVTNIVLGMITRFQRGKILATIFNLILSPLFYIIDLITIIFSKDLTFFA